MHQTNAQRKHEILMRSSVARLKVINAAESAGQGVSRCVSLIPLSGKVARYSLMAAAGLATIGVLRLLRRKPAPMPVPPAPAPKRLGHYVVAQALTMVLLPWLRQQALQGELAKRLRRFHPVNLFFRWVGLDK